MYSRHASIGFAAQLDEQHSYVKGGVGGRWLGEAIGQPYEPPNEMARRSHRSTLQSMRCYSACVVWTSAKRIRTRLCAVQLGSFVMCRAGRPTLD